MQVDVENRNRADLLLAPRFHLLTAAGRRELRCFRLARTDATSEFMAFERERA